MIGATVSGAAWQRCRTYNASHLHGRGTSPRRHAIRRLTWSAALSLALDRDKAKAVNAARGCRRAVETGCAR
ncbi:hypothetical protein [Nocardia sp. MW-W600-9]